MPDQSRRYAMKESDLVTDLKSKVIEAKRQIRIAFHGREPEKLRHAIRLLDEVLNDERRES